MVMKKVENLTTKSIKYINIRKKGKFYFMEICYTTLMESGQYQSTDYALKSTYFEFHSMCFINTNTKINLCTFL